MRNPLKMFSLIALPFGILLLWAAGYVTMNMERFDASAARAEGRVIQIEWRRASKGQFSYPVVEFRTADERRIVFKGSVGDNPPAFHEGETVVVLYDPANPQHASIRSVGQQWSGPLLLGGLGLVFTAIPAGIMFSQARRRRQVEWLKKYGWRISTRVVSVEVVRSYAVRRVHPYRILARGQNPLTNEAEIFHSDDLWSYPITEMTNRSVDVLIDPNEPKRYWLDTDSLAEQRAELR